MTIPPVILYVFLAYAVISIILRLRNHYMLANLIAQVARLRDEILPALTAATGVIAGLRADLAAAQSRIAELEAEVGNLPQVVSDFSAINDQLAALAH